MSYGNMIYQLNKISNTFTPKERLVFKFFQGQPQKFQKLSIQEIADMCQVSVMTVMRFVKKAGFDSFSEFKHSIKQLTMKQPHTTDTAMETLRQSYDLLWEQLMVNQENVQQTAKIVELLETFPLIDIVGVSSSGFTALELSMRLMRLGFVTRALVEEHFMIMQTAHYTKDNLIIAISLSGKTDTIVTTLKQAKENEATTILLTNHPESPCAPFADYMIVTPKRSGLPYGYCISNQIPQLMYLDYLYQTILTVHPTRQNAYEKTLHLILPKQK